MNDIMTFRRKQIEEEFDKEIAAQKENKLFYLAKQTQKKKDKWIARGRQVWLERDKKVDTRAKIQIED